MKIYQDREFSFVDRNSRKTFKDLEFRRCHFVGCGISITNNPKRRSTIRNIRFINCEQHGSSIDPAIIEDVLVENFKTNGLVQTWGAVFKHVVLRGRMGRIMISSLISDVAMGSKPKKFQIPFDEANSAFYSEVDWALDIREAKFQEADLRGVPGRLIKRDPETQFLITRERALQGKWREVELNGTHWGYSIEMFLESGMEDEVFVAPKIHPKYRILLDALLRLRDAGVLE
jgi:hypothetical protein